MTQHSIDDANGAAELASRLGVLQDLIQIERGKPYTFSEVQGFLLDRGAKISQARWTYMLSGNGPRVSDSRVLVPLAELYGVPLTYLADLDSSELPERVEKKLEQLRKLRESEVQIYATRRTGPVNSDLAAAIAEYLKNRRAESQ